MHVSTCEGFAGRLLARPRIVIVATHADTAANVTDERRSVSADTSSAIVDTIAVKFADDFDVVQRLFAINCQRPTYTELKSLRLCLAEIRTAIVSVSRTFSSVTATHFHRCSFQPLSYVTIGKMKSLLTIIRKNIHRALIQWTLSGLSHVHSCQRRSYSTCVNLWHRSVGWCRNGSVHTMFDEEDRQALTSRLPVCSL